MTASQTPPSTATVPEVLRTRDQWLCWREQTRDGKSTKVPIDAATGQYASATDPDTWGRYQDAQATLEPATAVRNETADGLGFVFTAEDPFVGVDLDSCRDPETGHPDTWAKSVISTLASYTEVSPSGTGYHVLVRGRLPGERNRSGDIELYEDARYFTVTGDHVAGTPETVELRTTELETVYAEYLAPDRSDTVESTAPGTDTRESNPRTNADTGSGTETETTTGTQSPTAASLSDTALLDRARAAANGEKFARLWQGNTSGYDSHSEADMALCSMLAFWTGGDTDRVNRLFARSGLHREKWDEVHFSDGSTYGEKTAERATAGTSEFYEPTGSRTDTEPTPRTDANPRRSHSQSRSTPDSTVRRESPGTDTDGSSDDPDGTVSDQQTRREATLHELRERNATHLETIAELTARIKDLERRNERLVRARQAADDRCAEREAAQQSGRSKSRVWTLFQRIISR
ncbi:phage NrS-1 polymerase family protein [Halostella litorea]|uniref:phage NrS-1 polymerase family protein n=1 Tax=Halostella litorea TaxID=2528831 RepID=UPI001091CEE7|nr:hypothetical protein [Halostella litorea]